MSAKPTRNLDQYINDQQMGDSYDSSPNFTEENGHGQDIFVEDDPAVSNWQHSRVAPSSVNIGVDADLKTEKLTYICQMLNELRILSTTMDEPMIAYLIEMAILETDTALNVGIFRDGLKDKIEPSL